ncbi:MAG: porin family protein [Steroidobacteraceae bacterium]
MLKQLTLAAALLVTGAAAHAADNGLYLGVGLNQTDFNIDGAVDDKDNGYKAIVGFRLLDSFGVEANYADHGEAVLASSPVNASVEAKTASAFAVGFLDFPLIDLFAKAGLAYTDAKASVPGLGSASDSSTDFAWGAGVQAHFLSFAVRAEYERFETDNKFSVLSASLIYTFL